MKEDFPIFETTQSDTSAISGLNRTMWLVKSLAMVFPASKSTGVSYRTVNEKRKQVFAPSLAAVIYACFHHDDDPKYFDAVNIAMTGKGRYTYDRARHILKPDTAINKGGGVPERLRKAAKFRSEVELDRVDDIAAAADVVADYLTSPDSLKDDVGKTFEIDLIDTFEYAAPGNAYFRLLDSLKNIKDSAKAEYVSDLRFKYPLPDGTIVVADPSRADKVGWDEVMTYVACKMSEHYGDNVLAAAVDAENTGKMPEKLKIDDALNYAKEWVSDNGRVARKRERRTGSDAAEYVPLDVDERNDLVRAPVAPENIIPMFARDCNVFVTDGMSEDMKNTGYSIISSALGLNRVATPDEINEFIRTELVPDTATAKMVREHAIGAVKKYRASKEYGKLADNILRHVFQYKNDELYSRLPSISGSGAEIRHRRTGVAVGNITSKITDAFNPLRKKFIVVEDEHPEIGGMPGKGDKFTVDLDGIQETFSRMDKKKLHDYERPELVDYNDPDTSYPIYAIWEGIVPFTKMIDNRPEYDIGESEETIAARKESAQDQIAGAMQSIISRSALSSPDIAASKSKPLIRKEMLEIGDSIETMNPTWDVFDGVAWAAMSRDEKIAIATRGMSDDELNAFNEMDNKAKGEVIADGKKKMTSDERDEKLKHALPKISDPDLRNYILLTALQYYNDAISEYYSNEGKGGDDILAERDAFMYVMGNPDTMMTHMSSEEIIDRIAEKSMEFAAAREAAGDADESTVGAVTAAYMTDFFNMIDTEDIPEVLSDTYGNDSRSIARDLREYVKDLLDAVTKVVSGYGYSGLRMRSNYIGGRYSFNNRLSVDGATFDRPIGEFEENEATHAAREAVVENVLGRVAKGLRVAVGNPEEGVRMLRDVESDAKASGLLDDAVTDSSIKSAMDATDGNAEAASVAYGILRGVISKDSFARKLIGMIDSGSEKYSINGIKPPVSYGRIETSIENLKKSASDSSGWFGKSLHLLEDIQKLSNGGTDFKAIRNMVGLGNTEKDRLALGVLMSAVDSCRKTAERVGNLEPGLLERGFVDTGLRRNVGEPEVDLSKAAGEEELAGVAAPEDSGSDLNDVVGEKMEDWQATPGYNTYRGLTGMLGFDTIRVGQSGDSEMAISLADKESVSAGINESGVINCAVTIDDALNNWERLTADGEKGAYFIASRFASAWADRLVVLASDYMLQKVPLEDHDADDPNGHVHRLTKKSAEGWAEMTKDVINDIKAWCMDNAPAYAVGIADEIVKMLDSLSVKKGTWEEVSKVSTAFAHMILKLGEFVEKVPVPDPLKGKYSSQAEIPPEVMKMIALRSMPGKSTRGDMGSSESLAASKLMRKVRDRMKGDHELAQLLSNLYETYGRNSTEGYAGALDAMNAAAHAAGNKTDRAKTELKGGIAPTAFAASLYQSVWDSEEGDDAAYTGLIRAIESLGTGGTVEMPAAAVDGSKANSDETVGARFNSDGAIATGDDADEPMVLGDIIHMAGLNDTVDYGPERGNTYAGVAFDGNAEMKLPLEGIAEADPDVGRKLALALRVQMVDSLLSDRSFEPMRDNAELWKQFSDRVCGDALDIDGTSSALLFVTLDHATLNVGREARQADLRRALKEQATLGEERLSDRMVSGSIGAGTRNSIDSKALAKAIMRYVFGATDDRRNAGFEEIRSILGDRPAETFKDSIDGEKLRKDTSAKERPAICKDLAEELADAYGTTAEERMVKDSDADKKFISDVNTLKNALWTDVTGEKDSSGHTAKYYREELVPSILGDEMTDVFFDGFAGRVPASGEFDRRTLGMAISKYIRELIHSPMVGSLLKNAGLGSRSKSNIARWNLPRETGISDVDGSARSENTATLDSVMSYVEGELARFKPDDLDDTAKRRELYWKLGDVGFDGSIDDFCEKVKTSGATQTLIARLFAHDEKNYNPAMLRKIRGRLGAFTPTKSIADNNLVVYVARRMENAGLHSISMVHSANGDERPMVLFANRPKPRSVKTGDAARQFEMIMDMYKEKYGKNLVGANGDISDDNLRKLDKMLQKENVGYPIDPVNQTREIVPIVLGIMNNTGVTGGRPWGRTAGGTAGNHIFEREVTFDGNRFATEISEELVVSIVRSIVRDGIKSSDIAKDLEKLRKYTKSEAGGNLMAIAEEVKRRIQARVKNLAKGMVETGTTSMAGNGIRIKWLNPENGKPAAVKKPAKPRKKPATVSPDAASAPVPEAEPKPEPEKDAE